MKDDTIYGSFPEATHEELERLYNIVDRLPIDVVQSMIDWTEGRTRLMRAGRLATYWERYLNGS